MVRIRRIVLSAMLAWAGGAVALSAQTPAPIIDVRCGAYSLYVGLRALDLHQGDYEAFEADMGPPSEAGYSMADLVRTAEKHGAHTLAVESSLETLPHYRRPFGCIALLERSHYVNVIDVKDGTVTVADVPDVYDLPAATFRHQWTGKALLIASEPLTPVSRRSPGWLAAAAVAVVACLLVGIRLLSRTGRCT